MRGLLLIELGVGQAISWATFKEEFNDRFFPKMVQEAKAKEFMDLQGGMTLAGYAAKFKQLSWFALYLIPEDNKAKKLETGLKPRIRTQMTCFEIKNFSQLVNRASLFEESLKVTAAAMAQ